MTARLGFLCAMLALAAGAERPQSPAGAFKPAQARAARPIVPAFRSVNLDLARTYERLRKWSDAEKYYQEAAREPDPIWREALAGIERTRTAADAHSQDLAGGEYYRGADVPEKAEDQYVAALKSGSEAVRVSAQQALNVLAKDLLWQRTFERGLQNVKYLAAFLAVLSFLVLTFRYVQVCNSLEVSGFVEIGEKVQGRLPFWLAFVRSRIRSLATIQTSQVSPTISTPALLFAALPNFRDEIPEPVNEIEVGGTKLPLASILDLFFKPKIKISGGWTAPISPADGVAFATVFRRRWPLRHQPSVFLKRPVGATTTEADLEAFAYDVYVKAVEEHAQ